MANKAMVWDAMGQKFYETGVSKGGLYLQDETGAYPNGVAWNGLSSVAENPSGGEETKIYADNQKYLSLYSAEDFGATVECYTTPDEFDACDGKKTIAKGVTIRQQDRKTFGMTYQTILGNDTKKDEYGYKIHIIYGAVAKPSSKTHSSTNESPEASTMSYELSTTPVAVTGSKSTAYLEISVLMLERQLWQLSRRFFTAMRPQIQDSHFQMRSHRSSQKHRQHSILSATMNFCSPQHVRSDVLGTFY